MSKYNGVNDLFVNINHEYIDPLQEFMMEGIEEKTPIFSKSNQSLTPVKRGYRDLSSSSTNSHNTYSTNNNTPTAFYGYDDDDDDDGVRYYSEQSPTLIRPQFTQSMMSPLVVKDLNNNYFKSLSPSSNNTFSNLASPSPSSSMSSRGRRTPIIKIPNFTVEKTQRNNGSVCKHATDYFAGSYMYPGDGEYALDKEKEIDLSELGTLKIKVGIENVIAHFYNLFVCNLWKYGIPTTVFMKVYDDCATTSGVRSGIEFNHTQMMKHYDKPENEKDFMKFCQEEKHEALKFVPRIHTVVDHNLNSNVPPHKTIIIMDYIFDSITLFEYVQQNNPALSKSKNFDSKDNYFDQNMNIIFDGVLDFLMMIQHRGAGAHNDLNYRNIMIQQLNPHIKPVIVDFGSYTRNDQEIKDIYGMDKFRAPEFKKLLQQAVVGYKQDMWALGCLAFFYITGFPLEDYYLDDWSENCQYLKENSIIKESPVIPSAVQELWKMANASPKKQRLHYQNHRYNEAKPFITYFLEQSPNRTLPIKTWEVLILQVFASKSCQDSFCRLKWIPFIDDCLKETPKDRLSAMELKEKSKP